VFPIKKCSVPADTLLEKYSMNGGYADCYTTDTAVQISLSQYVLAFYTTSLFKLERFILNWTVASPSTDSQAKQLAHGDIDRFAAWSVEDRNESELLMCDLNGRTRSWLMVASEDTNSRLHTRLYFGSAVVPIQDLKTGISSIGLMYQALLGFHQIYSVLLLYSAKVRVRRIM
jgi:hypothetical protein